MVKRLDEVSRKVWVRVLTDPRATALVGAAGALLLGSGVAHAITAPAQGSFAYDVYDIAVNKMLGGPIGFVGGVMAMAIGAISAIQQRIMAAIPCIIGGAMLLKADSILTSLGAIF